MKSYRCFAILRIANKKKYLISCKSFKWLDGASSFLICLFNSLLIDSFNPLYSKRIKFLFVNKRNSEQIKYFEDLTNSSNPNDNELKHPDVCIGSQNTIQKFEKEFILTSKITI